MNKIVLLRDHAYDTGHISCYIEKALQLPGNTPENTPEKLSDVLDRQQEMIEERNDLQREIISTLTELRDLARTGLESGVMSKQDKLDKIAAELTRILE